MARIATFCLCSSVALLVGLGMVMLASTGFWSRENPEAFRQQTQALILAMPCMLVIIFMIKPEFFRKYWKLIFVVGCILLALCYVPGVGVNRGGASRWVKFPMAPQFQASEFGKIAVIIAIAAWYASRLAEVKSLVNGFIKPGMILVVPLLLIMFEKDVDTAMCVGLVGAILFFCVGVRMIFMLPIAVAGLAALLFMVMKDPVRKNRIDAWKSLAFSQEVTDPALVKKYEDLNRQQKSALIAFTNGGSTGVGLGESEVKHGQLPASHTDFIFPVVAEELGLLATLGVVFCYIVFAVSGMIISMRANQMFSRVLSLGLTMMIAVPAFLNMAVVTVSFPNMGLPLPFISYGGTNLICSLITVAIIISVNRHTIERSAENEFAIPEKPVDMRL